MKFVVVLALVGASSLATASPINGESTTSTSAAIATAKGHQEKDDKALLPPLKPVADTKVSDHIGTNIHNNPIIVIENSTIDVEFDIEGDKYSYKTLPPSSASSPSATLSRRAAYPDTTITMAISKPITINPTTILNILTVTEPFTIEPTTATATLPDEGPFLTLNAPRYVTPTHIGQTHSHRADHPEPTSSMIAKPRCGKSDEIHQPCERHDTSTGHTVTITHTPPVTITILGQTTATMPADTLLSFLKTKSRRADPPAPTLSMIAKPCCGRLEPEERGADLSEASQTPIPSYDCGNPTCSAPPGSKCEKRQDSPADDTVPTTTLIAKPAKSSCGNPEGFHPLNERCDPFEDNPTSTASHNCGNPLCSAAPGSKCEERSAPIARDICANPDHFYSSGCDHPCDSNDNGKVFCLSANTYGTCDHGCVVSRPLAAGMTCRDGVISPAW
jgi:hypothetical protein